ncbi:MAG: DUF3313 domain-containing protein [Candidatus Binataceae bacterium]
MKDCRSSSTVLPAIFAIALIAMITQSCSSIRGLAQDNPGNIDGAKNRGPAQSPPAHLGLFSNYAKLPPAPEGPTKMIYMDRRADWKKYNKIIIGPLTCLSSQAQADKMSLRDQQTICNYADKILRDHLASHFTIVSQPGPDVMVLRAALVDAESASPGVRTSAAAVPRAHLLDSVEQLPTASYAFASSAKGEAEVLNSRTRHRMAAWVDRRAENNAFSKAMQWRWGDAQSALDFWARQLTARLVYLHTGKVAPGASSIS